MKAQPLFIILFALLFGGCAAEPTEVPQRGVDRQTAAADAREAIVGVMEAQSEAWNRGDIEGFMEGYARTDSLRFASGGTVHRGWQTTLDRYLASYPDRAAMGMLAFTDLDIDILGDDRALVFGRWRLGDADEAPNGLFTLIFARRSADGAQTWRIIHDHTSATR